MPPVLIEDRIKKEVPFLSNVMLIGDKRKYVTCLVSIKVSVEYDIMGVACYISMCHIAGLFRGRHFSRTYEILFAITVRCG